MKKNLLIAAALLGATLAGCSKDEPQEGSQNPDNAIQFTASAGRQTRAPVVDNANISSQPFGLYAYYTGQNNWATATVASVPVPNFMNDQEVSYGGDAWSYSPLKYWPNTAADKLSFFGYWPKQNGVTSATVATGELPVIHFTQKVDDAALMTDFIVSHLLNQTKQSANVVLPFKHVLTRLNFSAKVDRDLTADQSKGTTGVFVTGLRVLGTEDCGTDGNAAGANAASKFYANADYKLTSDATNGEWDYTNAQRVVAPLNATPILNATVATLGSYSSTSVAVDRSGIATKLLKSKEFLFLIPPGGKTGITSPTDIRVQVDYEIVTVDGNVSGGFAKTTTSATVSLPNGALMESKAYNITLTFGLTEVNLDTDIIDWDNETGVDAPSADAASGSDADIVVAMGALNGVKAVNTNTNYFIVKVPGAAATLVDVSTAAALYNFEEGDQMELAFASGVPTTVTLPAGWTYKTASGKAIIVKESPRGWYIADMTGADEVTDITILDATTVATDLSQLRTLLLGGARTRAVAAGTINLAMPFAKGIQTDGFLNCTGLKTLNLPHVEELGNNVFEGCSNLTGLALAWKSTLATVGTELFGSGNHDLSKLTFITGPNTAGVNAKDGTWTVNGTTYTFGSVKVENASNNIQALLYAGQQEWNDGGTITITK